VTRAAAADAVLPRRAAVRLGLQASLLVSTIVVLLTGTAAFVVLDSQNRAADSLLTAAVARADDVVDPPAGTWLVIESPDGSAATPGVPAGLADRAALARAATGQVVEPQQRELNGVAYRIETVRHADGTAVQGILDLTQYRTEHDRLVTVMLLCGALGLLLAAAAGTWLGHRALRPLSTALSLQRRFVADAGHELRTPVTLLHTRAQLVGRRLRGITNSAGFDGAVPVAVIEETLADIDGVVADSGRLGEILEDMLLAADPLDARPQQPVELVEMARGVLAAARPAATEHDVRLRGPEPGTAAVVVPGAPVALRRALTALVDNAVRHAHREVVVTVVARNGQAHIDVIDDGPGIDPELAPRLFHRFVSGRPTAADGHRRYGLGLAVVNEIAAAHGGRVELLNGQDPGAALRIQLPGLRIAPRIL
jgi:two-component system OmpR family sensor kinase